MSDPKAPPTDEELDRIEDSWRQGRPLPGSVHLVLAEIRRLRKENAELRATQDSTPACAKCGTRYFPEFLTDGLCRWCREGSSER